MFTPDLSLFNISLTAAIAIILASYAIFLVKLKPMKEPESTPNRDFAKVEKTAMKTKTQKKQTSVKAKKNANEGPVSANENENAPEEQAEGVDARTHVEEQAHTLTQEVQKGKEDKEAKKSFLLFGKRDFEGCPHKFGYLGSLPKNTPIPDECFGCPRILECLVGSKNK